MCFKFTRLDERCVKSINELFTSVMMSPLSTTIRA